MLFMVRGKSYNNDRCLRIQANTPEEAEAMGWKQGLFVTEVTPLDGAGSTIPAKLGQVARSVWRAWRRTPADALQCFGKPLSSGQAAALLLCGCMTWVLNLRTIGVVHF